MACATPTGEQRRRQEQFVRRRVHGRFPLLRWHAVVLLLLLSLQAARGVRRLIAAGTDHSCAIVSDGKLKCWGEGSSGQLGYEDRQDKGDQPSEMGDALPFVNLGTGRSVVSISLGNQFSCALLDDRSVKCWGDNGNCQLGLGEGEDRGDSPGEMGDTLQALNFGVNAEVLAMDAGGLGGCAVLGDHSVKCWWGCGNDGTPYVVDLGASFAAIDVSVGGEHMCALSANGKVKCWRHNSHGELGRGNTVSTGDGSDLGGDSFTPIALGTSRYAVAISAGGHHTCALLDNGGVKCWGLNSNGQLGYGDEVSRGDDPNHMGDNLPFVKLGSGRTAVAIDAGLYHTCTLLDDGSVKCWGHNGHGQLGQGNKADRGGNGDEMGDTLPPIQLGSGRTVVAIAVGKEHVMALLGDGSVKCWGANGSGLLGLGDTRARGADSYDMGDNLTAVALGTEVPPLCKLGTIHSASSDCMPCPENTWALAQAASENDCVSCPAGKYSKPKRAACVPIPPSVARLHVMPSADDFPVALRVDDEENDETYFFVDRIGRVGINTNVHDEAEETLVVNGPTRLRGSVFLDDDSDDRDEENDEETTLQQKLAKQVEFVAFAAATTTPLLMQSGRVQLHGQDDVCAVGSDLLCADVSLTTPLVSGSEVILFTVHSLHAVSSGGVTPTAWISDVTVDVADEDMVGGFVMRVLPSVSGENDVVVEVQWMVLGVAGVEG